ncbi:MAG TPA: cytochrome c [Pseudolabrys sp.]|jgi:mono/diheme cytochrome c family protein|nr:cytochrome c [Pseudolabrys sp.]
MNPTRPADHATARAGARRVRTLATISALALILTAAGAGPVVAATGDYTQAQASAGQHVYSSQCASCHGGQLQGGAGPALAGYKFASNLQYSGMSAKQLYSFISKQMPANAPGSLSKKQYLQVMAYILSKNGYPQGSTPLSQQSLSQVNLLPYPGSKGGKSNQASAH